MNRRGIPQNPYKIPFFKAFARREHCSGGVEFSVAYDGRRYRMQNVKCKMQNEIATPLRCTTPPLAGLKARGKLARDDRLLRYVAGFFMRREYKTRERDRRSPGARRGSCQLSVVSCQLPMASDLRLAAWDRGKVAVGGLKISPQRARRTLKSIAARNALYRFCQSLG